MSITGADVVREVRALANQSPEFVYTIVDPRGSCLYVHEDGQGGCIVGQALMALGVSAMELGNHEGDAAPSVIRDLGIEASLEEELWLDGVQTYQDDGETWSFAVRTTDMAMENR